MSETKKPGPAPKGAKRRGRTKPDKDAERAPDATSDAIETAAERDLEAPAGIDETVPGLVASETKAPHAGPGAHEADGNGMKPEPLAEPRPSAPAPSAAQLTTPAPSSGSRFRLSDEYTLQTFFDKGSKQHVAMVAEFPEMRFSANTREAAVQEMENKIENHVENLRRRGEQLPEAFATRKFPEKLELRISQGLFRRLDNLSRHEKVSLDQLVVEMLSGAVEKRLEPMPRERPPQRPAQGQQQPRHNQPEPGNRKQGPPHRGQHHGGHRRGNQEVMENRESFMEYVRNLEKSGGGRWKK